MTKNMGTWDRLVRLVPAAALIALILGGRLVGTWAVIAGIVAAVLVLTATVAFCPLYRLLGLSTCPRT